MMKQMWVKLTGGERESQEQPLEKGKMPGIDSGSGNSASFAPKIPSTEDGRVSNIFLSQGVLKESPRNSGIPIRRGSEIQFEIEPFTGKTEGQHVFTTLVRTTVPIPIHPTNNYVNVCGSGLVHPQFVMENARGFSIRPSVGMGVNQGEVQCYPGVLLVDEQRNQYTGIANYKGPG